MNGCHKLSITTIAKHNWHSRYACKSQRCRVTASKQQWQAPLRFRMQINLSRSCEEGCGHSQAESNCTQTDRSMQKHAQNTMKHRHTLTPIHRVLLHFTCQHLSALHHACLLFSPALSPIASLRSSLLSRC